MKVGVKKFLPIVVALLAVALVLPSAVVGAPEASAIRTLPTSVAPGANFDVSIEASGCGAFGQVVETLPSGFSYVGTDSTDVSVTEEDSTVKFTFIGDSVSFDYTVAASTTAGTYSFSGVVKDEDKIEYAIGGDSEIGVTVAHPEVELESSGSLPKAAFATSNLSISPSEADIGETVTISLTVTNTGNAAGSYEVTLKIDGAVEATKEVTLNAGASKEVTFTTAKDVAASYSVDVSGLSGSFSIREKPAPPPPPEEVPPANPAINWPVIGGVIAGVVIVGLLIFFLTRRKAL